MIAVESYTLLPLVIIAILSPFYIMLKDLFGKEEDEEGVNN